MKNDQLKTLGILIEDVFDTMAKSSITRVSFAVKYIFAMFKQDPQHTFHIPVMGTGYTIDTPLKVAHFGISSVMSIIDHRLMEQMRKYYCTEYQLPYIPIEEHAHDSRAKRITAYIDLIHELADEKFAQLKKSEFGSGKEIDRYFQLLPESTLKTAYSEMLEMQGEDKFKRQEWLRSQMKQGSIDGNIMTKIDRVNFDAGHKTLPVEFNDAHSALRGFANSQYDAGLVLSAGLNPRLYSYMANFGDFFPDEDGYMRKKIILKVSDYRSALIQGKFLAKKGLWVSEFRIESGLNCGGHAFATNGLLLGPIMQEFINNREALTKELYQLYITGLRSNGKPVPENDPYIALTVQGGVGTNEEHNFLLNHFGVDSVGWGSPFLLAPDVANVDPATIQLLCEGDESQYYLSRISPLGVMFNTIRNNTAELQNQKRIEAGKPGARCSKNHLLYNTEFTEEPICESSHRYQSKKIEQLNASNLSEEEYAYRLKKVTDKVCLCTALGNSTLMTHNIELPEKDMGVAICPGPNLAWYTKTTNLDEMCDHIYGRINLISRPNRPNLFFQEFNMYLEHLRISIKESIQGFQIIDEKQLESFRENLLNGLAYYKQLFLEVTAKYPEMSHGYASWINDAKSKLEALIIPVHV